MKLEEGEVECEACGGTGLTRRDGVKVVASTNPEEFACKKCDGSGRVNWIENIFGKQKNSRLVKPGVYVEEVDLSYMISPFQYNDEDVWIK